MMSVFTEGLNVAASGMQAQATRLGRVSENIANADTPGYRRKETTFETALNGSDVEIGALTLDQRPLEQIYDPSSPLANDAGYYDGTNVDLLIEIADAREAQRSYDANLKMFDQLRQMSSSLMDLLRR